MNITVINGTNRIGNKTMAISHVTVDIIKALGHTPTLVTLNNFTELFRGDYLTLDRATPAQKKDIEAMIDAEILLFVVPIYHHGIPSPLKNFLDLVDVPLAYEKKVIGLVSSSKTRLDGVRQAAQVINGILSYEKLHSFVTPNIPIINYAEIDQERLKKYIQYCIGFK